MLVFNVPHLAAASYARVLARLTLPPSKIQGNSPFIEFSVVRSIKVCSPTESIKNYTAVKSGEDNSCYAHSWRTLAYS